MKTTMKALLVILFLAVQAYPQKYLEKEFKGSTNPDELVTLSPNVSFNQAIALLSKISESVTGKKIVSTVDTDDPIGIEINNMDYDKALVVLVQYKGLIYEEKEDVIVVKRKAEVSEDKTSDNYAPVTTRDVKISAVFFELDVLKSRQRGVDWKVLLSHKGLQLGSQAVSQGNSNSSSTSGSGTGTPTQQPPDFNVNSSSDFELGNFFGQATAMFRFFEEENIGEIIASPSIIVRDRKKGRIQVGSDFSVKQKDFAGNVIEQFFPTGTIIEVTPYVYTENNINYMLLNLLVERSSFIQGQLTTEIRKTNATTQVMMLNGEEVVLGGLYVNDETTDRTGVPFLKDLPWWFFGLRYIFGSDSKVLNKKELVILLKAEILPTLEERLSGKTSKTLIRDEVKSHEEKIKYYKLNQTDEQ
jgi:type II secretory pathway component HofQ